MKRPLFIITILYMLGIFLGKIQIFSLVIALCLVCLGLLLLFPKKRMIIVLLAIFMLIGYGLSDIHMDKISALNSLHNQSVTMQAQVIQPPVERQNRSELYIQTLRLEVDGTSYPSQEKVLASLYYQEEEPTINLEAGDVLTFEGKIRIPKEARNPGGFDYSLYLRTKKVYATTTIIPESIKVNGKYSLGFITEFIYWMKDNVQQVVEGNLSKDHGDLLKGILFGEKELNEQIRDTFVDSGIAHVLAVSGLHVGFLIGFMSYMTKLMKVSKLYKFCILTVTLLLYILITGGAPSVIRASIMAWIYLLSKIISKRYDGISALSLAGLLILLPNPLLLFTASFQLSFLAALSIIIFYPVFSQYLQRIKYLPKSIANLLTITLAAQIGTLPASLFHFNQLSLISLVTNLLIIPFLGVLLLLSILAITFSFIVPFIGSYLFFLTGFLFEWVIGIAGIFSSLPYSSITLSPFTWSTILIYTFVLLIVGGYIPLPMKSIRIIFVFILFGFFILTSIQYILSAPLRVTFLDVNQGDSILIETPRNKRILIDGGGYPSYQGSDRKISEDVLLPTMYSKKIKKLDLVIVSHPHDDHMKGIEELIGRIPIATLGIYDTNHKNVENLLSLANQKGIQIVYLKEGNRLEIEKDIGLKIVSPGVDSQIRGDQVDLNNSSLVMKMDFHEQSFLFTGDIEGEIEDELIESEQRIQSTVLKVAHHGSGTSSSEEFIRRINPRICVISVGENNTFGHPSPSTIQNLEKINANIYRTDENGAVEVSTNGKWLRVNPYIKVR